MSAQGGESGEGGNGQGVGGGEGLFFIDETTRDKVRRRKRGLTSGTIVIVDPLLTLIIRQEKVLLQVIPVGEKARGTSTLVSCEDLAVPRIKRTLRETGGGGQTFPTQMRCARALPQSLSTHVVSALPAHIEDEIAKETRVSTKSIVKVNSGL